MKFLWRGRPPKVAQSVLCQKVQDGGLNAVNVELFCKSLKMVWLRRMYFDQSALWRELLQKRIGKYSLIDVVASPLGKDDIKSMKIPKFYRDILAEFQRYNGGAIKNAQDAQKEKNVVQPEHSQ